MLKPVPKPSLVGLRCPVEMGASSVRGYPVREVSQRLGVSTHSLYVWIKKFSAPSSGAAEEDHAAETRRLKRELARVTKERDILKKVTAYFARDAK